MRIFQKSLSERWLVLGLLFLTFAVYFQVLFHEFISFDDSVYIVENPYVRSGISWQGILWAFTRFHDSNWFPLTWLSHMLDYQFFGLRPGAHHLVNVFFHLANTCLLFVWLRDMSGESRKALFVAALFALHPLHVESVAWASERKDMLSGFFWMLTLAAYGFYAKNPGLSRYLLTLLFYAAGILSKPMVVTLPFAMLLLDFWPLGRMNREKLPALLKEKILFLILSAVSSVVTYIAQSSGGAVLKAVPFLTRLENAALSYIRYLKKTFWPTDLGIFYSYDVDKQPWFLATGSFLLILALSAVSLARLRKNPWVFTGWFWFLGTLVPVIGFVQVGGQAMADRYTYLPLTGIFIILAWGIPELLKKIPKVIFPGSLLIILALSVLCARQVSRWKDSLSLYEHTLSVTKDNHSAHQNISGIYAAQGDYAKAEFHLREALRLEPEDADAMNNLANVLRKENRLEEALDLYERILAKNPSHIEALINLGVLFSDSGEYEKAMESFERAMRFGPKDKRGFKGAARVSMKKGDWEKAESFFASVLAMDAYDRDANLMLGNRSAQAGDWAGAENYYRKAARWHGEDPEVLNNLANTLAIQGKLTEAFAIFQAALKIAPRDPKLNLNYGLALARAGNSSQASYYYRTTLLYDPSNQKAMEKLRELEPSQK